MRRLLLSVLVALSLAMPLAAAVPGTVWAQTRNQVVPPTPETRAAPAPATRPRRTSRKARDEEIGREIAFLLSQSQPLAKIGRAHV